MNDAYSYEADGTVAHELFVSSVRHLLRDPDASHDEIRRSARKLSWQIRDGYVDAPALLFLLATCLEVLWPTRHKALVQRCWNIARHFPSYDPLVAVSYGGFRLIAFQLRIEAGQSVYTPLRDRMMVMSEEIEQADAHSRRQVPPMITSVPGRC